MKPSAKTLSHSVQRSSHSIAGMAKSYHEVLSYIPDLPPPPCLNQGTIEDSDIQGRKEKKLQKVRSEATKVLGAVVVV
jgi:hypothetical protein